MPVEFVERMQQNPFAQPVWAEFLKNNKIKSIIELGTARGGFTEWLSKLEPAIPNIVTVDIQPGTAAFTMPNVDYRVFDCFTPAGRAQVLDLIDKLPRPLVLMCDNGNKIQEVNDFGPYLRPGDFLATHDYAKTKEYFQSHIREKIWSWHEIWDEAIQQTLDIGFHPVMEEQFAKAVWGVWCLKENAAASRLRKKINRRERSRQIGGEINRAVLTPLHHEQHAIHESKALPWRATMDLVDWISTTLPKNILAFGTSRHTPVFAKYLDARNDAKVTVIEEDTTWAANNRRELSEVCNLTKIDYRIVPVLGASVDLKGQEFNGPYDLVVMDGPKDFRARSDNNVLTLLREQTTPETAFYLNNVEKPEMNAVREAILTEHGNWSFTQKTVTKERKHEFHETCLMMWPKHDIGYGNCDVCICSWNNHPDRLRGLEHTLKGIRLNWTGSPPRIWIAQETKLVTEEQLQQVRDLGDKYNAVVMDNPAENTWAQNLQLSWSEAKSPYIMFMEDDWILQKLFDVEEVTSYMETYKCDMVFMRMWFQHTMDEVDRDSEFHGEFFERNDPTKDRMTLNPFIRRHPMQEFEVGDGKQFANNGDAESVYQASVGELIKEGKISTAGYNVQHFVQHYNMEEAKTFGKTTDGTRR